MSRETFSLPRFTLVFYFFTQSTLLALSFDNTTASADQTWNKPQSVTYDPLYRLTQGTGTAIGTRTYAYNSIGNLLQKDGVTCNYGVGGGKPHAVVSGSDGFTASYDFNGNLIQHRAGGLTRSLSYDLENQLTRVAPSGTDPAGVEFTYDFAGDRIKQAVGSTTTLYPDDLYELETSAAGTTTSKQVVLGSFRVATRKTGAGAGTYFHHADHLGSTAVVTDAAGAVVRRLEYLPFGATSQSSGVVDFPQKFTGKRLDASTNFYYFGARHYDPQLGRWLTPDPTIPDVFDLQSLNRYSYVRNNPLRYTDPDGLEEQDALEQFVGQIQEAFGGGDGKSFDPLSIFNSMTNGGDAGRSISQVNAGVAASRSSTSAVTAALFNGTSPAHAAMQAAIAGNTGIRSRSGSLVGPGTPGKGLDPRDALIDETAWLDWLGGILSEPVDWWMTISDWEQGDFQWTDLAALLPILSHTTVRGGREALEQTARTIEKHHLLPKQYRKQFKRAGLDIEQYTVDLPASKHRLKPSGVHTGSENWNREWRNFFEERRTVPTRQEILEQLRKMRREFGI